MNEDKKIRLWKDYVIVLANYIIGKRGIADDFSNAINILNVRKEILESGDSNMILRAEKAFDKVVEWDAMDNMKRMRYR